MTAPNDYSAQITIGGMTFNTGVADVTVPAQTWYAAAVGWESCPKRVVSLPNIHNDGDQPQHMNLAARPLTLQGTVKVDATGGATTTKALLDAARDRLLKATMAHPDALVRLTVNDTEPTYVDVHLAEDPLQWNISSCDEAGGVARFRVGLIGPAGARYSVAEVSTTLGVGLATPDPALTSNTSGGSNVPGTYTYQVTAVGAAGETLPSSKRAITIAQLPTPGAPAVSSAPTGGSLNISGIYSYKVTAVNAAGETLPSVETTIGTGGSGPNTRSNTVTWSPISGATGYKVYGRSSGSWLLMTPTAVTGTSFVDTGSVTPSGNPPTSNTTATNTNTITLTWPTVSGATGYNVYGRKDGAIGKLTPTAITTTSFTDTGSVTPAAAPPTSGAASVQVTNNGNWPTPIRVTVNGPATNPITFTSGSSIFQVDTALGSGETLIVDFGAMSITVNGQDRRDFIAGRSVWWKLPAGTSRIDYSGGGTASATHRHAWA